MCMMGDDEDWAVYSEGARRARKAHKCVECRRVIEPGETYRIAEGLFDRTWYTHKTCAHCDAASRWLEAACGGWLYTLRQQDLGDHVVGHEKEIRSAPLTRLLRWMLADWRDRNGDLRSVDSVATVTNKAIAAYRRQFDRALT